MSTRFKRTADKNLNEKHAKILRECLQLPENKFCADCKKKDPRWASWNLGIFICIRCSGTHRSLGTHISRVKSVDLDTWTPEQVENMVRWGNARANTYWEANLKSSYPSESNTDQWIRLKYETKRWAMKGPIPDPSTLGDGFSAQLSDVPERKITAQKLKAKEDDDFDIFVTSHNESTSTMQNSSPISQLRGAELFSLGKPASASSAPSSPTQQKASLPLPRSTTPNPTSVSSHETLKSSILSLYNSPTLRPVTNAQPVYGLGQLNSSSSSFGQSNLTPGRSQNTSGESFHFNGRNDQASIHNTRNTPTTSIPQGGTFFGAFSSSQQPSVGRSFNQQAGKNDNAFGDLLDFTKFQ